MKVQRYELILQCRIEMDTHLAGALVLAVMTGASATEPVPLPDEQLDLITAGAFQYLVNYTGPTGLPVTYRTQGGYNTAVEAWQAGTAARAGCPAFCWVELRWQ